MDLQTVQVRVLGPVVGDDLVEENELRAKRRALEAELAAVAETDEAQVKELEGRLDAIRGELETRLAARTVTIDVQTATFGGRIRQMEAMSQVEAWRLERKRQNAGGDADAEDKSLSRAELEKIALTPQQSEDYVVMSSCAALVGAVCRDEDGHPVCSGFHWPETMHGWTQVPAYIIEPTLMQVYALNPSWTPAWMAEDDDDASKN